MTISILTNYSGLDTRLGGLSPYDVAKVLYAALPNFIGGNENRKEAKIILCWKGKEMTVARPAAAGFIQKGAYLGGCETIEPIVKDKVPKTENALTVYPNPAYSQTTFTIRVTLRLIDPQGNVQQVLFSGMLDKGNRQTVSLSTYLLPTGFYTAQLVTPTGMKQQQLVILK